MSNEKFLNMNDYIYLDTYVLQQDMRIRLPKAILNNMGAIKGSTNFAIYLNKTTNELILRIIEEELGAKK